MKCANPVLVRRIQNHCSLDFSLSATTISFALGPSKLTFALSSEEQLIDLSSHLMEHISVFSRYSVVTVSKSLHVVLILLTSVQWLRANNTSQLSGTKYPQQGFRKKTLNQTPKDQFLKSFYIKMLRKEVILTFHTKNYTNNYHLKYIWSAKKHQDFIRVKWQLNWV